MHLSALDLNLLRAFDALIETRSVSQAAARVGLTQPAMSHALNRLRSVFGDVILVRSGHTMQPTRKALELAPEVRDILDRVRQLGARDPAFDPARSSRTFTLGMTDYAALKILPRLSAELLRVAPTTQLVVRQMSRSDGPQAVEAGQVDMAIGIFLNSQRLRRQLLEEERFMCAIWSGNALVRSRLSLAQYLKLQHVMVASHGDPGGVIDRELGRLNHQRSIFCVVPHAAIATGLLRGTDLILTLGEGALREQEQRHALRILRPPFALPTARFELVWHPRTDADPALQWIRGVITQQFAGHHDRTA